LNDGVVVTHAATTGAPTLAQGDRPRPARRYWTAASPFNIQLTSVA